MAGELATTIDFSNGDQVTSAKLDQIISQAYFTASAVSGTTLTVTGGKLKVGTITSAQLGNEAVTAVAIAPNAVTTAKIYDGNVTTAKIADRSITTTKIAVGTILFSNLSTVMLATKTYMQNESSTVLVTADFAKYTPGAAKSFGNFTLATSRVTKASKNITSITAESTTSTKVVLSTNMASDDYVVVLSIEGGAEADVAAIGEKSVYVFGKVAGTFYIKHPVADADLSINFAVYGTLNA